jgi:ring-1,2-phenylacetyl-CoA epoxidase subunit PaaA
MQKAENYGLEIPEYPRIRNNGDGTYEVVEDDLDWDEFFTVSKNEYHGSIEQIDSRAEAQEAVEWVRNMMNSQKTTDTATTPMAAD